MKKICKKGLALLLTLVMVSGTVAVGGDSLLSFKASAYADASEYPYRVAAGVYYVDQWNFYQCECTSFVAWCLNARNGVGFHNYYGGIQWGDADNWSNAARSLGITVNGTPAVGAVARSGGHVAWVTRVNGNGTVDIEEYNYGFVVINEEKHGCHTFNTRNVATGSFEYIHIKDLSANKDPIGSRNNSGDFNGDGMCDYAVMYDYGKNRAQVHVFLSTGSDFSEEVWWRSDTENSFDASRVSGRLVTGDFNGDGKDDIAMMYQYSELQSSIFVLISNGKSFSISNWKSLAEYKALSVIDRFVAGDFNGDGKYDIAAMYEYDYTTARIHVFLSTGNSFADPAHWLVLNEYCASKVSGRVLAGDFNGDGKFDIAAMYEYDYTTARIHVFLSNGNSFADTEHWLLLNEYCASKVTGRMAAGDYNGDGRCDIAAMYPYDNQVCVDHVWLSNQTSFSETQLWAQHSSFIADRVNGRFFGGDINGDSKDDIAALYYYLDKSGFHILVSTGFSFNSMIWNQIAGYDCSRTTGINSLYDDDYTATFRFTKKTIYYTLSYSANCGINPPASQTGNGNVTLSNEKPIRDGYTFKNWNTKSDGSGSSYNPGATYCLNTNVTLFAIWKQNAPTVYTLTYNANGGTDAPAQQTGNGSVTLSAEQPTRSGYTFLGWATSSTAASVQYAPSAVFNLTANIMLYAVWQKNIVAPTIKIHNYTANKTVDYRTTITFSADEVKNPVKDAQIHWFIDGQDKGASDTYTVKEAKKDFTVQAKYIKDGKVLAQSEIETVKVNAGFFARLKAFFRALFKKLPVIVQEYLGVEIIDRIIP